MDCFANLLRDRSVRRIHLLLVSCGKMSGPCCSWCCLVVAGLGIAATEWPLVMHKKAASRMAEATAISCVNFRSFPTAGGCYNLMRLRPRGEHYTQFAVEDQKCRRMRLEIVGTGARQLRSSRDLMQDLRYRREKSVARGQFQAPRYSLHVSFEVPQADHDMQPGCPGAQFRVQRSCMAQGEWRSVCNPGAAARGVSCRRCCLIPIFTFGGMT
jgi:hypothetical protein